MMWKQFYDALVLHMTKNNPHDVEGENDYERF